MAKKSSKQTSIRCSVCKKFSYEPDLIPTQGGGYNCEGCYEPEPPKRNQEDDENEEVVSTGISSAHPVEYKAIGKTKIFQDVQKFLNSIEFDARLLNLKNNIPDYIRDVRNTNDVKPLSLFRDYFDKWMRLLTYRADYKCIITDRGTGKSKNAGLYLLSRTALETFPKEPNKNFYATFVMRNYDDNTKIVRPQYEGYIDDFISWFYPEPEQDSERKKWKALRDQWRSLYRAIVYEERERIAFVDLYNPAISKKADKPHDEIFFEEAMPTMEQIKKNGGWVSHGGINCEETNYEMVRKSASRGISNPRQTFLGNPNCPWLETWFLLTHFEKELEEISAWYWKERKKYQTLASWRKWTWSFALEREIEGLGKVFLYLEKIEHEPKFSKSEEDWCWDVFFKTAEALKIVKFVNGSEPLYVFNQCIIFYRDIVKDDPNNSGYWTAIDIENPRYPNRDTIFKDIKEQCICNEHLTGNDFIEWKVDRRKDKDAFREELLSKYRRDLLKFNSAKARERMLLFINKGKAVI